MMAVAGTGPARARTRAGWREPALLLGLLLFSLPARPDALPLWEIRSSANRVYILGSIHFLRPDRDRLPAAIISAYRDAEILLMELDLDDLDPVVSAATLQRLGLDPQGRSLEELIGSRDYAAAAEKSRSMGIDIALVRPYEPWLAAITISQLRLQQMGFDASAGVEQQLLALAIQDGKEVRGLETLEQQVSAMDALPAAAQRAFLLETIDEAAGIDGRIDEMVAAWREGNVQAMEREFLDDLRDQPELYRRIVVDRNRNWAGQVAALARERRDYLVVVGTLHLVGPDSLIRMLEDAGFAPRQLEQAPGP